MRLLGLLIAQQSGELVQDGPQGARGYSHGTTLHGDLTASHSLLAVVQDEEEVRLAACAAEDEQ
jgi:hypothetical protein